MFFENALFEIEDGEVRKVGNKLEKLINSGKITSEELMSSFATLELHCLIMYLAFRNLRITFEEFSQSRP